MTHLQAGMPSKSILETPPFHAPTRLIFSPGWQGRFTGLYQSSCESPSLRVVRSCALSISPQRVYVHCTQPLPLRNKCLKVPSWEIFDLLDSHDFENIKPTLVLHVLKNFKSFRFVHHFQNFELSHAKACTTNFLWS